MERDDQTPGVQLVALAEKQGGHVAVWQAMFLGLSARACQNAFERRGWHRVHQGVYRVGGVPASELGNLWAALLTVANNGGTTRSQAHLDDGKEAVRSAQLAVTDIAAVTAFSAAWHLGARQTPPKVPQLLVSPEIQVRIDGVRVIRSSFDRTPVDLIDDVPTVRPERLLWDCAWVRRRAYWIVEALGDMASNFDRRRMLAVDELLAVIEEPVMFGLPRRVPGRLRMAAEVLRPGFSHSRTEAIGRAVALEVGEAVGLEFTPRPFPILRNGRIIAEADIAAPALRWDVEIDGPHHRAPSVVRRDRVRDQNVGTIDWSVTRYGHELIDDDLAEYRKRLVREALRRIDLADGLAA